MVEALDKMKSQQQGLKMILIRTTTIDVKTLFFLRQPTIIIESTHFS